MSKKRKENLLQLLQFLTVSTGKCFMLQRNKAEQKFEQDQAEQNKQNHTYV